MVRVNIAFNQKEVAELSAYIGGIREGIGDMTALFASAVPHLERDVLENFNRQGSIEKPWPALNPKYAARKRRKWGDMPMLVASGAMVDAATRRGAPGNICEITPKSLFYGTDMTQAGIGAKFNYALAHDVPRQGSRIPQREFFAAQHYARRSRARLSALTADFLRDKVVQARRLAAARAVAAKIYAGEEITKRESSFLKYLTR